MVEYKDIYVNLSVFTNILTSCVEVFPKETIGLLGGNPTLKRNNLIVAYPVQLAERKRGSVGFKNEKVLRSSLEVFESMQVDFYGFYHSHPKGIAIPSDADLAFSVEKLLDLEKEGILEIIIKIDKKGYKKKQNADFAIHSDGEIFHGYIKGQRNRFDFEFVGEWVEVSEVRAGRDIKIAVPNRYAAKLKFLDRDVLKLWDKKGK